MDVWQLICTTQPLRPPSNIHPHSYNAMWVKCLVQGHKWLGRRMWTAKISFKNLGPTLSTHEATVAPEWGQADRSSETLSHRSRQPSWCWCPRLHAPWLRCSHHHRCWHSECSTRRPSVKKKCWINGKIKERSCDILSTWIQMGSGNLQMKKALIALIQLNGLEIMDRVTLWLDIMKTTFLSRSLNLLTQF